MCTFVTIWGKIGKISDLLQNAKYFIQFFMFHEFSRSYQ